VALLASAFSVILLFFGLPNFMKMSRNDNTRFLGVCILALGIITVVTTAFYFQEFWREPITGNYRNLIDS
jgi:Na+/melibiose symporter-like transporter